MTTVLVVDDEPTIAEIVSRYLERAGFDTLIAADGPSALASAAAHRPDLVVLDLMLPGIDGLEVMRRLHADAPPRTPVILLTARGEEADRVAGLRRGADDYLAKPFSPAELVARVEAVLRRLHPETADSEPLRFGDLEIDLRGRRVLARGEEVGLTLREFDLLAHLAAHPGQVFTRDQLMESVWHLSDAVDTTTVTVHVRRVRAKIEAEPERPRHVQTVWGVGYRFTP